MKIGKKKIVTMVLSLAMILGIISFPSQTISADAEKSALAEEVDNTDALHLNKTAKWENDENGNYVDVNLEAFTTGKIFKESKPLDIVFVLDQSGSMNDPMDGVPDEVYEEELKYDRPYYVEYKDNWGRKQYREVNWCETCKGWFSGYAINFLGKHYHVFDEKFVPKSDINDQKNVQFYNIETRKYVLKDTLNSFVESVRTNAEQNNVNHRMSFVGFGSENENTEILNEEGEESWLGGIFKYPTQGKPLDQLREEDYRNALVSYNDPEIDQAINALDASGATRTDLGMQIAEKILSSNKDEDRQQIIIMFTDGVPTSQSNFDDRVAINTINFSNNSKTLGAEVYTVGVFDEMDADLNDKVNNFMNKVSSNYKSDGSYIGENKYYFLAKNSEGLNDIFDKIFNEISRPGISLNGNSRITDVISDYFELRSKEDISVYTAPCIRIENNSYDFGQQVEDTTGQYKVEIDGDKISLRGFDYNQNFCATDDKGNVVGNKIILKLKLVPRKWFIGGNAVPTNKYKSSGVYDNENNLVKLFNDEENQPKVDVDINYHYENNDAAMYITEDWKNFKEMIDGGMYRTVDTVTSPKYSLANNKLADNFVNIKFMFKNNEQTVAEYTFGNNDDSDVNNDWIINNKSFSAKDFKSDFEKFKIELSIEPKEKAIDDKFDNKTLTKNIDSSKESTRPLTKSLFEQTLSFGLFLSPLLYKKQVILSYHLPKIT
ncbi:VWA domain-containing protein [Amedibacterium intestinale]|uniref:VWA domain-containing protein n=2 Tax=Amedibacterium intestinale TaxID=2583452 RepID=UPI0022DF71C2|nr:vWA domain-containing protein [Amedibacterium intestinale]